MEPGAEAVVGGGGHRFDEDEGRTGRGRAAGPLRLLRGSVHGCSLCVSTVVVLSREKAPWIFETNHQVV